MDYSNEKFIVVYPDGTYSIRSPEPDERMLKFLQSNVEGLIDCVELKQYCYDAELYVSGIKRLATLDMFVNDEGLIEDLPINHIIHKSGLYTDSEIHGTVVLACSDIDGSTIGLLEPDGTDLVMKDVLKTLNNAGAKERKQSNE